MATRTGTEVYFRISDDHPWELGEYEQTGLVIFTTQFHWVCRPGDRNDRHSVCQILEVAHTDRMHLGFLLNPSPEEPGPCAYW
jgi:hypothetical protein